MLRSAPEWLGRRTSSGARPGGERSSPGHLPSMVPIAGAPAPLAASASDLPGRIVVGIGANGVISTKRRMRRSG